METVGNEKTIMTLEEVAALIGFSYYQARRLAMQGKLPMIKIGSRWLAVREDFLAWLRNGAWANLREEAQKAG
jgi:excisionase family DNA binding protein